MKWLGENMKAIILAAGVGKRLRSVTEDPKCLLNVNGKALIQRYLEAFDDLNIRDVRIVVGYGKEKIKEFVRKVPFDGEIEFVENKEYEKGSILSLWKGIENIRENVILMDGDVYFEQEVLRRLVESSFKNCLIVDTTSENRGEEVIAGIRDDKIKALGRGLRGNFDLIGEWVGFIKCSKSAMEYLKQILDKEIKILKHKRGYEEILPLLFKQTEFNYEMIDGLKWIEIDFPEDIKKVGTHIYSETLKEEGE